MSALLVHRRPRRAPADVGVGQPSPVRLAPPPPLADASGVSGWTYALFPVLGSVGMLVIALVNRNPLFLIAGAVFVLGSLGMGVAMFAQMRGRTQGQRFDSRGRYFSHLAAVRAELAAAAVRQRASAATTHPAPDALLALVVDGERTWERRPGDADFLLLRLGVGTVPALAAPALREADPTTTLDPAAQEAAGRLVATRGVLDDVPVGLALRAGTTTVVGGPGPRGALARAVVAQLAALHAPDDVRVALAAPPDAQDGWAFMKWLPHVRHPAPQPSGGAAPLLLADTAEELAALLGGELDRRRRSAVQRGTSTPAAAAAGPALVVVLDGPSGPDDPFSDARDLGVVVVRLVPGRDAEPAHTDVTVELRPGAGASTLVEVTVRHGDDSGGEVFVAAGPVRADGLGVAAADALARALAPLELSHQVGEASLSEVSGLPTLLGVDDVGALDPAARWAARPERDLLSVPLGVDADGRPVVLDLRESALGGMGPHGLAVGATGSGKSELLRTLVTGLAITHGPQDLAFVLVDYKGGATFAGLDALPHVAGSITDLEDDPGTVARMASALRGELRRRERVLRDSGDLASIREHRARRLSGADVPALPHLLVVIDEFSELLTAEPEMIDLFVTVGRLGRSLGVHLLLATQRLEEGRLKGLESHLSYRLALRTFSAAESRAVIGNADAYELPAVPGSAYLKVDTSVYQRMRVATVSAPYACADAAVPPAPQSPRPFAAFVTGDGAPLPALGLDLSDPSQRSTLDVAVQRLAAAAPRVAPVWLPPLPTSLPLGALLARPARAAAARPGALEVVVGLVDLPETQAQAVLALDLAAAGGHLGVVGAPQGGKTTFLRTLVTSLCSARTPAQVQVYGLDLGGGGLAGLGPLPHVGVVAGRRDPELMRRTVAQLSDVLDARERWFPEQGVESVEALRALRAGGSDVGDAYGEIFLVVDGWAVVRAEHEDLERSITGLATRGAAYGLHLVVATPRWADLRPALKDALGTRVETRLGDAGDTVFTRAAARSLPAIPGRVLVEGDRRAQVALPHLFPGRAREQGQAPATPAEVGAAMRSRWDGPSAPPVLLLPERVDLADLPDRPAGRPGVVIGLRERDGRAASLDLVGGDPHLLVVGDARSGRTTALRTLVRSMTANRTDEELRVVVVDYRRTLLDACDDAHLSQYCASPQAAAGTLAALFDRLAARLPGPEVTREQLRARGRWQGPRALVVVDDHDLVDAPSGDPVAALLELLPVARDVGLHVVLARPAGGIAAAGSPVLRRLRELGGPGLLLSGPREEGPVLHGVRLRPLPPGRAVVATRQHEPGLVQVAWTPEDDA